jgi:TP901 family phage tail tape measure protein
MSTIQATVDTAQAAAGLNNLGTAVTAINAKLSHLVKQNQSLAAANANLAKSNASLSASTASLTAQNTTLTQSFAAQNAAKSQSAALSTANAASTTKATAATNANTVANTKNTASYQTLHGAIRGTSGALGNLWMTYGQIAPLLAAFSATALVMNVQKLGSAFEYMTKYSYSIGDMSVGLGKIREELLGMKETAQSPTELASGLRELTKAGVPTKEALESLGNVAKFAAVSEQELAAATYQLVTMQRAFEKTSFTAAGNMITLADTADIVAKAALSSATNFSDFQTALKYTTALAGKAELSLQEVSAAAMMMANAGLKGSIGTTALRTSITRMMSPLPSVKKALKEAGVEMSKFATGDNIMSLEKMFEELHRVKEEMTSEEWNKFSKVAFGLRGELVAMAFADLPAFRKALAEVEGATGFVEQAFASLSETTQLQVKFLKDELQGALIKAFDSEAAKRVISGLRDALKSEDFERVVTGLTDAVYALGSGLSHALPLLAKYGDDLIAIAALLTAANVAQHAFNITVAKNPYIAAATALIIMNEQLAKLPNLLGGGDKVDMSIGSITKKYSDLTDTLQKLEDVVTGKRDAGSGKMFTELELAFNRMSELEAKMAGKSFHIRKDTIKEMEELRVKIVELQEAWLVNNDPGATEFIKQLTEGMKVAAEEAEGIAAQLQEQQDSIFAEDRLRAYEKLQEEVIDGRAKLLKDSFDFEIYLIDKSLKAQAEAANVNVESDEWIAERRKQLVGEVEEKRAEAHERLLSQIDSELKSEFDAIQKIHDEKVKLIDKDLSSFFGDVDKEADRNERAYNKQLEDMENFLNKKGELTLSQLNDSLDAEEAVLRKRMVHNRDVEDIIAAYRAAKMEEWVENEREKFKEAAAEGDSFVEGMKAGFMELEDSATTWGEVGVETVTSFKDLAVDAMHVFAFETNNIWDGLKDSFKNFANTLLSIFIEMLAEMAAKWAAQKFVASFGDSSSSDSSSSKSSSSGDSWVNTAISTVGSWVASLFADGGYIGSHPGGGVIRAGSGVRDDVFLGKTGNTMNYGMGGEYIVNKKATAKFLPLLEELNSKGFADGGQVSGGGSSTSSSGGGYLTQLMNGLSATNQAIQGTTTALEGLSATIQEPNGPTRDFTQSIGEYSSAVTTSAKEVAAQTVEIKDSVEATKDAKEGVREFGVTTSGVISGLIDAVGFLADKAGKATATVVGSMVLGVPGALVGNVAWSKWGAPVVEGLVETVKGWLGVAEETVATVELGVHNISAAATDLFGDLSVVSAETAAAITAAEDAFSEITTVAEAAAFDISSVIDLGVHDISKAAEFGSYSMTSAAENAFGSISVVSAEGAAAISAAAEMSETAHSTAAGALEGAAGAISGAAQEWGGSAGEAAAIASATQSAVSAISNAVSSAAHYDMSGSSSGMASHEATGSDMGWWATGGWIGKYGSGRINQGSGTKDDVFLGYTNGGRTRNFGMGGEFVVNKKSAAKHAGLLNTINRDFADGGSITPAPTSTTVPLRRDSQISQYLGSMMTEAVDAFSALKYYEDQLNSSRESAVDVLKEAVELSDNEELRDLLTGYVGEIEKSTLTDYQLSLRELEKTYADALEAATELGAGEEHLDIIRQASALATQKLIDENQEAIDSILSSYTSILDDHDFSSYELEARDMLDTAEAAIVEIGKLGAAEEEMAIIRAATILQLYNLEQQRQDEIKSALSSYQELLDTEGLSSYERSVRDVSLAQVEAEETLTGLGASLEDFQTVAEGVALQLAEIEKQRQDEIKSALSSYQGLLDVEGLSDYERSVRDVSLAQVEAEETLTELGASFRDFQTVTEGVALQLAEIEKQRQDSVDSTLSSYREFLDTSLLTAYELAVRNLNVSYQDSIDTLNELGATEAELSVLRTAYFAEMRDALADETRTAIDSYLADLLDKTTAANDKLAESESALSEAQSLLEQSFTESITEAGEMYRDEIDKLNESISSTTSNMESLRSMIDSLVGSPEQQQAKYETAQAALRSRYRSGNFSGDLSDISGATDISSSMFKSSVDMERETAKTSIMLDSLADKASSQLSADEKRLAALEKLRDDTIAELELQREIMLGTEEASSLTIEELKAQLEQAQITYEQDLAAAEAAEKFYKKQESQLEEEYNSILGIQTSLSVSLPQIRALLSSLVTAQYRSSSLMEKYVRSSSPSLYGSYATGTDYVPKTGPYLLHQGEAVVPAKQVQTETSRLLSVLISETKAGNVAIAKNTAAMAKYIKLWDGTGLPESREVAV